MYFKIPLKLYDYHRSWRITCGISNCTCCLLLHFWPVVYDIVKVSNTYHSLCEGRDSKRQGEKTRICSNTYTNLCDWLHAQTKWRRFWHVCHSPSPALMEWLSSCVGQACCLCCTTLLPFCQNAENERNMSAKSEIRSSVQFSPSLVLQWDSAHEVHEKLHLTAMIKVMTPPP